MIQGRYLSLWRSLMPVRSLMLMRSLMPMLNVMPMSSLVPMRCLLCQTWARQGICSPCLRDHAAGPERPRCPGCGLRLALGIPRCATCERSPPAHGPVRVAVDYAHPWDQVLLGLKFGGHPEWAGAMALLMARNLKAMGQAHSAGDGPDGSPTDPPADPFRPSLLLPVPLSPERLTRRGYNQAWELARHLARGLCIPARADVLTRSVDLPGQAEQDRHARLQRLRGVFQVSTQGRRQVAGRCVALVDDVLTTGATAAEASRALMAAGATDVEVWAFARTPPAQDDAS